MTDDDRPEVDATMPHEPYSPGIATEGFVDPTGFPYPGDRGKRETGSVMYAWQMQVEGGWNIVGMKMPTGQYLPLVTSSLPLAWEAFEIAQAHANVNQCQVRLAAFTFSTVAAIVDPND